MPDRIIFIVGSAARFAVPYIFCGGRRHLENIDRGHSLRSLRPPPAAVGSLTQRAALVGLINRRPQQREYERIEHPNQFPPDYYFSALAELVLDD